jgi:hypothetical protein
LGNRTDLSLVDISKICNPVLRGMDNYFGKFYPSELRHLWRHFNQTLVRWALKKYKSLKGKVMAGDFLMKIANENPKLFIHWEKRNFKVFV